MLSARSLSWWKRRIHGNKQIKLLFINKFKINRPKKFLIILCLISRDNFFHPQAIPMCLGYYAHGVGTIMIGWEEGKDLKSSLLILRFLHYKINKFPAEEKCALTNFDFYLLV